MRFCWRHSLVAGFGSLLIACGGGSSGGDTTGGTEKVVPASIGSITPADGATGVSRTDLVTVVFNEDMLGTSIDNGSFTLSANGAPIAAGVSFDGETNEATLTPSSKLSLLTPHTATLSTAIADLSGEGLSNTYSWTFTTADGSWGTAEQLDSGRVSYVEAPHVGVDDDGNAIAVWLQDGTAGRDMVAKHYSVNNGWGDTIVLDTSGYGGVGNPRVSFDGKGNAMVVWNQSDGNNYSIWANHYSAGSGWSGAEIIEDNDTGDAGFPKISLDSSGDAVAVWELTTNGQDSIWSNRYSTDSGWGSATMIESVGDGVGMYWSAQVASDGGGNAIAVWCHYDGSRVGLRAYRYSAGNGWGSAMQLDGDSAGNAEKPQIAFDGSGNAIVVWRQDDGTDNNLWAKRYSVAGGWGSATLLGVTVAGDTPHQIALDESGNAIVVWKKSGAPFAEGSATNIWASRYSVGSGWSSAAQIGGNDTGYADYPHIAFDGNGNALAVWSLLVNDRYDIWANRYTLGSGWGSDSIIEDYDASHATTPSVAANSSGVSVVVWNTNPGVWANRLE